MRGDMSLSCHATSTCSLTYLASTPWRYADFRPTSGDAARRGRGGGRGGSGGMRGGARGGAGSERPATGGAQGERAERRAPAAPAPIEEGVLRTSGTSQPKLVAGAIANKLRSGEPAKVQGEAQSMRLYTRVDADTRRTISVTARMVVTAMTVGGRFSPAAAVSLLVRQSVRGCAPLHIQDFPDTAQYLTPYPAIFCSNWRFLTQSSPEEHHHHAVVPEGRRHRPYG